MKTITKHNFWIVICCTYTILSLSATFIECIINREINPTQLNMVTCFILSVIGVFILSQQYRFEHLSTLMIIIIQYITALSIVLIILWIAGHVIELHKNAYRDIFISFSIPYLIGTLLYYRGLKAEVYKQNQILKKIKIDKIKEKEDSTCDKTV